MKTYGGHSVQVPVTTSPQGKSSGYLLYKKLGGYVVKKRQISSAPESNPDPCRGLAASGHETNELPESQGPTSQKQTHVQRKYKKKRNFQRKHKKPKLKYKRREDFKSLSHFCAEIVCNNRDCKRTKYSPQFWTEYRNTDKIGCNIYTEYPVIDYREY